MNTKSNQLSPDQLYFKKNIGQQKVKSTLSLVNNNLKNEVGRSNKSEKNNLILNNNYMTSDYHAKKKNKYQNLYSVSKSEKQQRDNQICRQNSEQHINILNRPDINNFNRISNPQLQNSPQLMYNQFQNNFKYKTVDSENNEVNELGSHQNYGRNLNQNIINNEAGNTQTSCNNQNQYHFSNKKLQNIAADQQNHIQNQNHHHKSSSSLNRNSQKFLEQNYFDLEEKTRQTQSKLNKIHNENQVNFNQEIKNLRIFGFNKDGIEQQNDQNSISSQIIQFNQPQYKQQSPQNKNLQNYPFYKIEEARTMEQSELFKAIFQLKEINQDMRKNIQKIGINISVLAKSSFNLNKEQTKQTNYLEMYLNSKQISSLQEISSNIETINSHFNDFHFKILQNDDNIAIVENIIQKVLKPYTDTLQVQNLEAQVKKQNEIHQNLQQTNFDQIMENKKLKQFINKRNHVDEDQNHYLETKMQNYKKLLSDAQKENKDFILKINTLEEKLQNKISYIQKFQEQIKNNDEQIGEVNYKQAGQRLAEQTSNFLISMKNLQKIMNVKTTESEGNVQKQQIVIQKQDFEKNKKILELMLKMTEFKQRKQENYLTQPVQEQQQYIQKKQIVKVSDSSQLITINNHLKQQILIQQDLISNYKLNIFQMQNKMQEQQQNIKHTVNQLDVLRNQQNSLLIQNTNLQDRIKEMNHLYIPTKEQQFENKLEQLQQQIKQYDGQLQEKNDKIQNFQNQILKLQENIKLLQNEVNKTVNVQKQIKQLEKDTNIQTEQLDYQNNFQMSENIKQLKLKLDESEQGNAQLQQQRKTQEISLQNFRKQNKALNIQAESVNKFIAQQAHDLELIEKLRNEINSHKNHNDDYKKQIENNNNQLEIKELSIQDYIYQINNVKKLIEKENDEKNSLLSQLQSQISHNQNQIQNYQHDQNEFDLQIKNLKHINNETIQELNQKFIVNQEENQKNKENYNQQIDILGQAKAQLQNEFNILKKQLESVKKGNQQEIQRLNGVREDQIKQLKEKDKIIDDNQLQIHNLNEQINQSNEDINQAQQISQKHQSTLEKNRDLISLLKDQIQKFHIKQKNQANLNILQQKNDLIQQENTKIKKENEKNQNQIEQLKSQVKLLKSEFEQKSNNRIEKIKEIQIENDEKEELINDANKVIEELQEFKHDIGAKFKHLVQIYVHQISQSVNMSSYKGDDSSLSINQCFDQIQDVLENINVGDFNQNHKQQQKQQSQPNLSLKLNSPINNIYIETIKDQQTLSIITLENIKKQLLFSEEIFDQNNDEMESQNNQKQVLIRKVANYKAKLQKQTLSFHQIQFQLQKIENINLNLQSEIISINLNRQTIGSINQFNNSEEIQILKQDKAALQTNIEDISNDKNNLQKQIQDQNNKLQSQASEINQKSIDINELINNLEQFKQLKGEKKDDSDSSNSSKNSKSQQIEQLEMENMELLAKLQKTEKDMQELRDDMKQTQSLNSSINRELNEKQKQNLQCIEAHIGQLNNKIILAKEEVRKQIQSEFNAQIEQIQEKQLNQGIIAKCTQQLLINDKVQLIQNLFISGEQYLIIEVQTEQQQTEKQIKLIQKSQLDNLQLQYIQNYMPQYQNELEIPSNIEDKNIDLEKTDYQNKKFQQFENQLQELRIERKDILEEYYNLIIKIEQNVEFEDQKDLQTMTEDVQYYTVENLELKLKVKSLVTQNLELKKQIIYEQNQKKTELMQNLDINEQDSQSRKYFEKQNEKKYFENNLSNILMEGANKIDVSEEIKQNINNDFSLISQQKELNLFNDSKQKHDIQFIQDESIQQFQSSQSNKNTFNTFNNNQVLKDSLSDMDINDQTQISVLEDKLGKANLKINDLQEQLKQMKDWTQNFNKNEHMNNNEYRINESNTSIDLQQNVLHQSLLQHLKGTLIQYLKKIPIFDLANEILLKIVFSMLNFLPKEIEDLSEARIDLPVYKIDTDLTKKAKKENQYSKDIQEFSKRNLQGGRKVCKSDIDQISQGDFTSAVDRNDIERISDQNTPKAPSTMRVIITDQYQNTQNKSHTPKQSQSSSANAKHAILGFFKKSFKLDQNKIEDTTSIKRNENEKQRKINFSQASNGGASDEKCHSIQNQNHLAPEKMYTRNKNLKSAENSDFMF